MISALAQKLLKLDIFPVICKSQSAVILVNDPRYAVDLTADMDQPSLVAEDFIITRVGSFSISSFLSALNSFNGNIAESILVHHIAELG